MKIYFKKKNNFDNLISDLKIILGQKNLRDFMIQFFLVMKLNI